MNELFTIIRFPFFLVALIILSCITIPLVILAYLIAPAFALLGWTWYLITTPIVLVWSAITNDPDSMQSHWAEVENGLGLGKKFKEITDIFTSNYKSLYNWLIGK